MAAELLRRGAAAAWDLSPAESPGRRRRRWADREEEDPAVLTLTHFSRPPFLSFGSLRPGASCTRLLAVDNPNPEEADVAIDRFPAPSTGFSLERRRFLIQSGERIFISITWMPLEEGKVRELVTFIVNGIVKHQAVLLGVAEQPLKKKKSLWDAIKKKNTSEGSVSTRAKQKHSNVKNVNKTFRVSKKTDTVRSPLQSCENLDVVGGSMSPSKNSLITLENKLPISPISPVLQEQHDTICTPLSMRRSTTYSVLGTVVNDELLQEIDTCNVKKLHNPNEQIKSSSIHSSPSGLVQAHRSNTHVCAPECTAALHSSLSQRRILSPDSFINDSYQLNVEIVAEQVAPILSPDQFVKDNLAIESVSQVHVSVSPSSLSSSVETCITKKSSSSKWKENEKMQYISISVEHKFPNDVLNETPVVKSQLLHCTKPEQNHLCFPLCDEDLQIRSCSQREQPKKRPVLSATVIKNKLSAAERKGMETTKPKSRKSLNNMIREDVSIIPRHSKLEILQNLPVIDPISGETKCHKDEIHSCSIGSTLHSRKRKNEVYLEDIKTTATEYVEETETKRIFTSCVDSKIKTTVRPLVSKHISREKLHHRKKAGSLSKTIIKTTKPIDGVAQSQLTFMKPLKTVIPRHPMPFAAKNMFYDERWKEKQQRGFTWWLNFILTPDDFTVKTESSQVNAAALILGAENHHKASVPRAPTKEEMSLRAYTARCRLNKLRHAACRLFTSETMVKAIKRLEFEIETRRLLVRKDRHLWKDIGERQKVLNWLLSYNPLWLRIGLETIYGELIALESNSDVMGLAIFILSRLLWNPDIAAEYRHPTVPHLYRDGHEEALSKFTLKKLLLLVCFLDHAKQSRIIDHDPCLFCKDAEFKNSKDVLLAFSRDFLSGEGDLSRHLGFLGLPVSHIQTPLDEFDFAVTNLAVDLQCGIRLVRTMELLTKNWSLSKKLRVPAISRLQKMHNVDVALHVLKERGIQLKDECGASIESKDIVDRHRERTLALLWKIVFAFQVDVSLNVKQLEEEISFLKNTHNIKTQMATLVSCSYQSKVRNSSTYSSESYSKNVKLLMDWVNAVCGFYNIKVENFTVSFSDGRVLCYLIHHYHPCYVPLEAVSQRTTQTVECTQTGTVALNSSSESDTSLNMLAGTFDQTITTSVVYKELLDNEKRNFQLINTAVSDLGGIPAMIHHSDMSNTIPDEKVVITYLSFLCSRLLDLRKETRAARLIQSVWRKYRLKAELKLHQEKDKAARIIQSAVINFLSHRRIQKKVNAAIFIQKHWRRYLAERKTLKLKKAKLEETKSESATVIQTYWRRFCARKRYLQLRYYVILVQARIRMMIAASAYKRLLWATVTIQRHLRASLVAKQDQQRYETLKSSSLVIQSAFRRWRKHKIEQKIKAAIVLQTAFRKRRASKLAKRERAAVVIQSWYRMHKDLKQYLHVRKSVIQIQAWLRRVQAKHVYEEKRACILMIQKYYRAYRLGKIQRKNYLQKRAAVTVLQAAFRGRKARLLYRQIKAVCVVQSHWRMRQEKRRFLLLKQSVVTLQSHVRKYQQLKRYKETKNAVCIIQTRYRAYVAAKNAVSSFQKIRLAAIVLQSAYRRMQARKEAHVLRSVVKIQSSYRAYVAQRRFENLKAAAVKIQAFIKMIQARKHYRALREAALYVQRRYRSQKYILQLKEYRKLTVACVSVQAAVRGHLIRKRVQRWREAATLLQAYYRMKRDRQRYLRVYSATVIIQNRYCAYQEQVHQRQKFLKVKKAVVCLQAAYRGYRVRKMLKLQYTATVKIQTAFRAHAARMKYQAMIQASLVIQRWYRAYKTGYKVRLSFLKRRAAVISLQAALRGWQVRKQVQRQHGAAVRIQTAFRKFQAQRFRLVNNAVLTIQQHYRASIVGRKQRQEYMELHNCIVQLQAVWRGRTVRKQIQRKHQFAVIIQSYYRMHVNQSKLKTLRQAVLVIQRHYRAYCMKKKQRTLYLKTKAAVLVLQAAFRGMRVRKQLWEFNKAATTIQATYRSYVVKKKYAALKAMTIMVQRRHRAVVQAKYQKQEYLSLKNAVVKIQAIYKGIKVRRQIHCMHQAAISIQAMFKMHRINIRYRAVKLAAIVIQIRYRAFHQGRVERKKYLELQRSSLVLQAAYRGMKVRRKVRIMHQSATIIQSYYRMHRQQKDFKKLSRVTKQIQQWYRACKERNVQVHKYRIMKRAILCIQAAFRGMKTRRHLKMMHVAAALLQRRVRSFLNRKKYISLRAAAVMIQRKYRAAAHAKQQHQEYLHVRKAVVTIQSAYRGFVVREKMQQMHKAATVIQATLRMYRMRVSYQSVKFASITIQQHYRAYKEGKRVREMYLKQYNSVLVLQAACRGMKTRQLLKKKHNAATIIQTKYRMYKQSCYYKKVQWATQVIQKRHRASKLRGIAVQQYSSMKKAATCIQRAFREMRARKKHQEMCQAAVVLQRRFKTFKERQRYLSLKAAAIVLQRRYRALILVRWHTQEYLSFRRAVIRIQSLYRGIQTRRNIQHMHLAASTIQSAFRMHKIKISYQRMRIAALVIQNYYRFYVKGKVQRKIYLTIQKSVLIIQAAYRGMKARQELKIMRTSATVIQSLYRMHKWHNHYKQLRWAVRVVQQRFRANRAREAEVKNYTKIKKAALCLQSAFRAKKARQLATIIQAAQRIQSVLQMYLDRRRFLKKKTAAVAIQSAFRCHRMKTRYKAIRDSTVAIQRWYRACRMARLQKAEYSAQRQAVIIIQSAYRGTVVRKMAKQKRAARKIQAFLHMTVHRRKFVRLRAAAVTLQSYYLMTKTKLQYMTYRKAAFVLQQHFKSHLAMKHQRGAYLRTRKSIIIIQSRIRGFIEQRKLQKIKQSTIKIQALFRGFKARQLAGKMRAARTIQAWLRRYRARKEYIAVVKATCIIQGYFKTKQQRTWFLKVKASTVTIQRRWRETLTARTILLQFLATKKAAVKIQSGYRRYSTRKQIKKMQQAACLIQAAYRGFKERHKFHQQKAAALVIQKHIRARQKGRLECIKYIQTRKAAIKLQAFLRGWLVRKKILGEKQKKRLLCFSAAAYHHLSAIKIQRAFRIHLVLKHAQMQISSVICIQRWFRARLQQKKSLQDHQKIIKTQRMVRRWLKQRNEAAITIQRAVRKFLLYKHRRKLKNGIIKFQALWRGYSWRKKNDTAKTKALRHSLEMANKESKEENKLCNRTAVAIDYLLKYKHLSYILAALKHLEVVTRLSPLCCENMAHSGAIFTIFILIRNCNRSIPCMEVIKYSVQVLLNVSKYERTTQAVYEVENSVDTLLDLLQMYREKAGDKTSEKGGSIFTKTCCLLAILLKDSKRAADIRSTSRAASRIHSLYKLTARKHKMDAERTLSKHKMHTSMSGSFFVPVTPVRTKVVSRIKPDWVLRKDNMQEIVDPLQAIRMVMDTLGTAYH
ncbi:abnormal spindle-like microcephaly-associated protein isoform X1 [Chelonia mydas]|uniref:abnormal spindle-like microcephaly-associated protein isoform X1 n=1 Tax=Chelonia mydas TaxID=8469 RepID=UPI0018A246B7|nr:abnormal spindle-like microcephaly-associated protein isoform X1 [Chelonia mydas]